MTTLDLILAILGLGFILCLVWFLITVYMEDQK